MSPTTPYAPRLELRVGTAPRWQVVLLDDDHHTYAYVVEMLARVCGHDLPTAFRMAVEVDMRGRVIVFTAHRERAELKQEQIHSYGADPRVQRCTGSMAAVLEALD